MQPLEKSLRSQLERAVTEARTIAEQAARAALAGLGVDEATPPAHLAEEERMLRRKLRAHGRQLGDSLNGAKEQTMDRLVEETAYEHWHRMLFARFLAENNLLMYPDPEGPVAISLEECEDLAKDEGAANGWELAARYAAGMLPQIFRPDSPIFQVPLAPEHQQKLERLLTGLPHNVFTASDSLGWVYQFWQADNKERIKKSEVKIGARELPAVTQLFTEPYMVGFLLDNSLGAWWAARHLSPADCEAATSEEDLRQKAAIPGVPLEYLRFVQEADAAGTIRWAPAAGSFSAWPEHLADFKSLDPCCGSGHFLVAAFLMLVPMRMALEELSAKDAVDAVLRQNIHGLELDKRCVELAAFALALAAWTYPGAGGYRVLSELHVACSGLSVGTSQEQWTQLAPPQSKERNALALLYAEFQKAPTLGSLVNPAKSLAANLVDMEVLLPALQKGLGGELDATLVETSVVAQGLGKAAQLLAGQYSWVVTNVPYLARGKQSDMLRDFCEEHYPAAKNELATVFLERCLGLCHKGGTASIVLPQNWLFLTSYKKLREKLLKKHTWHLIARLGAGAFETISGEVVKAILITLSHGNNTGETALLRGDLQQQDNALRGLDVSAPRTAAEKAQELITTEVQSVGQARQLENPDARVALGEGIEFQLLSNYANSYQGISPADFPRYGRVFWENDILSKWIYWQTTTVSTQYFGGLQLLLNLPQVREKAESEGTAYIRGEDSWGKDGVVVNSMRNLSTALAKGHPSDTNVAVIIPHNPDHLLPIWCFCSSPEYNEAVRRIDQKLNVTNATLVKVPFDLDHWTAVAAEKYPNGLPKPYTNDPTQWIFHGHPCGAVEWNEGTKWTAHAPLRTDSTVLHVAMARLLGYRWPAELDANMDLAEEQREWVNRCEALLPHADDDGIVCIPPVRGEAAATERLHNLLVAAYGQEWTTDTLATLLASADHAGKSLETWLRDKFFAQHCKLFHERPFIWHVWDGVRDGFAALVNYHKLDAKLLETLIYTYLGDWISRQKQDAAQGVDGAQERLAAAEALQKKLELILHGEAPYDIFVRWKPIQEQPLGWNPDLNDGVRLNIRPFLTVPDVGKRGAGVLRDKPNIKWEKDRGKDVESSSWFHKFQGDRINDHHLALAEKRAARGE